MKLYRTYINGSKQNELLKFEEFCDVNGTNWIEYLRLFSVFTDDIELVLSNRLLLFTKISHILFISTIGIVIFFPLVSILFLALSFISIIIKQRIKIKKFKIELLNNFTKNMIKREINTLYNF